MPKLFFTAGKTHNIQGTTMRVVASNQKIAARCRDCYFKYIDCTGFACEVRDRKDQQSVFFLPKGAYQPKRKPLPEPAKEKKRSSHAPSIEGDNQPGRLYRFLKRHFGKEFTTLALANEIDTVALHSVKNHVDQQLPPDERINVEWRTVNGKRRVYYSLVKVEGGEG